jgi:hypothetical protein
MKRLLVIIILFAACNRQEKPRAFEAVRTSNTDLIAMSGPVYERLKDSLDIEHTTSVTGLQNVKIYMANFKNNPNKMYAVSSKGDEMFYVGKMKDQANGEIAVLKGNEAVIISVVSGKTTITGLDKEQWANHFALARHGGGPGEFCQREPGESFSACYKAEADEFCDSFISCIAVNTQPQVVLLIAASCSCMIDGPL